MPLLAFPILRGALSSRSRPSPFSWISLFLLFPAHHYTRDENWNDRGEVVEADVVDREEGEEDSWMGPGLGSRLLVLVQCFGPQDTHARNGF